MKSRGQAVIERPQRHLHDARARRAQRLDEAEHAFRIIDGALRGVQSCQPKGKDNLPLKVNQAHLKGKSSASKEFRLPCVNLLTPTIFKNDYDCHVGTFANSLKEPYHETSICTSNSVFEYCRHAIIR
jgi:hypothetical protein